mgnify:CR=1 FL=1
MTTSSWRGRAAVITGGASGIGLALATALAKCGAHVIVADLNAERAERAAASLRALGHGADARALDVRDQGAVQALLDETVAAHGTVAIWANCAGLAIAGEARDLSLADWQLVLDVNLRGTLHGSLAAYQQMVRQGHGHLINIASTYGLIPGGFNAPYITSKFGVVGLTESLRVEGADLGVKVLCVCPGFIRTPILTDSKAVNVSMGELMAKNPLPVASPEGLAAAILKAAARDQGMLLWPDYVHWLHRLRYHAPGVLFRYLVRHTRQFRSLRRAPEAP